MTTTAPAVDVNAAFAAEKQGQIAGAYAAVADAARRIDDYDSGRAQAALDADLAARAGRGEIEMISADRYRVLTGWDTGEVFTVQRATRPQEMPLVLPEHGLDETTGRAALYTAVPAWHGLGSVVPGGTSDVEQVLQLGGLDWDVALRQVRYQHAGELREAPGAFVTTREDTGAPLGVVGAGYTPIQHRDAFAFLQELVRDGSAIWESAGALRGGSKVFISMRLPETVTVDAGGIGDEITPFVAVIDDHSGRASFQAVVTPWRPVCGNTERFAVRDACTRWTVRHTKSALQRLDEARRTLRLSLGYYEKWAAEETQLARTAATLADVDALIAGLWPAEPNPSKRQAANAANRTAAIRRIFAEEAGRVGRTAYAAERAVTAYMDHVAPRRALGGSMAAARATAVLEGSADDVKTRAHARLMLLRR